MDNVSELVVAPVPLTMLAATLAGDGVCVERRTTLERPDTGRTSVATATALDRLGSSSRAVGEDVRLLGRRLVGFVRDVTDTDDRVSLSMLALRREV